MDIQEAQKEMRSAFMGGFAGQLVSGVLWIISALIAHLVSPHASMLFLFFGCATIFPLTQLLLVLLGRKARVQPANTLWSLGSQIAFTVPLNFILVGAIILYRPIWFFPAAMIVVGTHYLPFITLYGMKSYGILAGFLIVLGTAFALYGPPMFSLGAWVAGSAMILFSLFCRAYVLKEESQY